MIPEHTDRFCPYCEGDLYPYPKYPEDGERQDVVDGERFFDGWAPDSSLWEQARLDLELVRGQFSSGQTDSMRL